MQEDNIVEVESPDLAAAYERDFGEMWATGRIKGTGAGDRGNLTLGEAGLAWDFAPGDGSAINAGLVNLVEGAKERIVIAAMVLTSHTLLAALAGAVGRGLPVTGIYDAGQMDPIVARWRKSTDQAVLTDWLAVSKLLVAKHSAPYSSTSIHDFMHNKILVCDDTVATGSFNFSANAQRNAENHLQISEPALAGEFVDYIDTIARQYRTGA